MNTRNSIVGTGGGAIETQQEFLALFESSVIENDISSSVQRYQLATQEAKLRLDLAIAPGVWLMPSNMIINTESVVGYNNNLMKATNDMKFGINSNVNLETKPVGISHNLGSSKVKLPQSTVRSKPPKMDSQPIIKESAPEKTNTNHEDILIILTIAAAAIAWVIFR